MWGMGAAIGVASVTTALRAWRPKTLNRKDRKERPLRSQSTKNGRQECPPHTKRERGHPRRTSQLLPAVAVSAATAALTTTASATAAGAATIPASASGAFDFGAGFIDVESAAVDLG